MRNAIRCTTLVACLSFMAFSVSYGSVTPGSRRCITFDTMAYFAFGYNACSPAITTLDAQTYFPRYSYSQDTEYPDANTYPLQDFCRQLSGYSSAFSPYGALAVTSKAWNGYANGSPAIEWYGDGPIGMALAQPSLDAYINSGLLTSNQVALYAYDLGHIFETWGITILPAGIQRYTNPANAIVHAGFDYSTVSAPNWGARIVAGYPSNQTVGAMATDANLFWDNLNGASGRTARTVGSSIFLTGMLADPLPGFDTNVVLSPAIDRVSPAANSLITSSTDVTIYFDARMDESVSPGRFLSVPSNNAFTITNPRWLTSNPPSDGVLRFTVVPRASGTGYAILNSLLCTSFGGIPTNPTGVGSNSASFNLYYKIQIINPVGAVTSFNAMNEAGGNHIRFKTEWESRSRAFQVEGLDAGGAPSFLLPEVLAQGAAGRYSYHIVDPTGLPGQRYRLVEHQTDSLPDLTYGVCETKEPFLPAAQESIYYDSGALTDSVDAMGNPGTAISESTTELGDYLIVCPDSFVVTLGAYASAWTHHNHTVSIVPLSGTVSQGGVPGYIHWAASHGCRSVLLVGDANDAAWWDDPTKWNNGWNWPRVTPSGPHIPSQPERNLIPIFYTADADSPQLAMSGYTPYFASDIPYADVDGDGLPDLVIGRLPASSKSDIYAYTLKLAAYLGYGGGLSWQNAYELAFAQDHGVIPGGTIASDADTLATQFPGSVTLTRYTDSGWTYAHRESLANAAANAGPDIIAWVSSGSQRYIHANFWRIDQGWSMAKLAPPASPGHFFASLGFSCDMANFDETEEYATFDSTSQTFSNPIRPIGERLLFDPEKGAIVNIGPSRGSFESGNMFFARELLRHLYSGGKNMGTAFMLAQRNAMVQHPEFTKLYRSYVLLGDPLIGAYPVTAVAEESSIPKAGLDGPRPNPFNPSTAFTVHLSSPATVRLGIYDVQGRLIRLLVDGKRYSAGSTRVLWDGLSRTGDSAGSGVYFVRLEAGSQRIVRKVVLLK